MVRSLRSGHLQTLVPCSRRVIDHLLAIIVPFPRLVNLASYWTIVCSNIMAHLDEHKLLSDKQHALRKWHSCETQLATVINDWAKILDNKGQVYTFILDFEKAFETPHMNFLRVNCLVMELVVKHSESESE